MRSYVVDKPVPALIDPITDSDSRRADHLMSFVHRYSPDCYLLLRYLGPDCSASFDIVSRVHFPLKSAAQLSSLTRKKKEFEHRGWNHRSVIERHLLPAALDYEVAKSRQAAFAWGESEISRPQLQAMFTFLLDLQTPISEIGESDLLELHAAGLPNDAGPYRDRPVPPLAPTHEPVAPERVPWAVSRFVEWAQSPSFSEMHPVQQMTLAQMRLYEIYPFRSHSEATVSLFSYSFVLGNGYLIPLYRVEELPEFYDALKEAFRFSTEALVFVNSHACERAYDQVLKE